MNNKRAIRRKADKIVLQNGEVCMKKKTKGTNEVHEIIKTKFVPIASAKMIGTGGIELSEYTCTCIQ